jgi:ankyrin repeat protein
MSRLVVLFLTLAVAAFAADLNEDLLSAARKGDLAAVKALCEKGASIEAVTPYGQTPLYLAAMNGHNDVVQFLIGKGARTDVKDTFYKAGILGFVIDRKHFDVARTLIAKGVGDPDEELATVADGENPDLVAAVLAKGKASPAARDKAYETALDQKQTAIADLLKKAGAHDPAPPFAVDPKILESYAGTYKADQIPLDIKVSVKEGKLYLQATGQPEFAPKPKSPTVFEYPQFQLQVEFNSAGGFTLKQGGREFQFKKAVAQ